MPTVTYVARPNLEVIVDQALAMPGAQILVYGPSATGKTTLVRKRLEKARIDRFVEITLSMGGEFSTESLLMEIAAQLAAFGPQGEGASAASNAGGAQMRARIF